MGPAVAQFRHCGTYRNVAGWIPDGVISISHFHTLSGPNMALESTQPLKK